MAYFFRARIRNAANTADALVVTSVPGGVNPYISDPPSGDGQGFNPRTGATEIGAYTVRIADNGAAANAVTGFLSDGAGRYDKLGRVAYLEYGTDGATYPNLLVAGYVTGISYPSAAEAQVTIGEAQRAERTKQAFVAASTTFPATTMLTGGPVRWPSGVVTPLNWPDRGPWTMKRTGSAISTAETYLQFVSGYVLRDDEAAAYTFSGNGALPDYTATRINTLLAAEPRGAVVTTATTFLGLAFRRVENVYADVYSAGALVGTFPVLTALSDVVVFSNATIVLEWNTAIALGSTVQVSLYTRTIGEHSPLHLLMHPMDVVTGLITDAGESYDATTAAAVKAVIGADVRVFLRLTQSEGTDTFIARVLGLFGVGRRMNSSTAWEFFDARAKTTSAPVTTIAYAELREVPADIWTLADSTILNNVKVTAQRFAIWAPGQGSSRPADSLVPVPQTRVARFQLADGTYPDSTQGVKDLTYDLPGTILNAAGSEVDLSSVTSAIAAPVFDRWGYGAPATTLRCRPTVTAQIGDETVLDLGFLPNGTVRGGQRIVQIVQRTNEPGGPVLVVEDAGLSAQPATAPTFTITASTRDPLTAADVTLTNAAALVASGVVSVLVEWMVSAGSPAVAGQDLGAMLPYAPIVLTTPAVAAGSKVWARAKSLQPGKRSGTFTAWASVTLTGVGAPTGLTHTATTGDGSAGTLAWTQGTNAGPFAVRVLLRLSALSAASDLPVRDLLAGSVRAALSGMTPGASYTATVRYVDSGSGVTASQATLTFTAGATVAVLAPPTEAVGVVGRTDKSGVTTIDGTYGLDVLAATIPGVVEFWEGLETAVGSGLYGTIALVASVPAVSGAATSYRAIAPHDGLRRELVARHVRTGVTASDFTYPVVLDPWGAVMLPGWILGELGNVQWTLVAGVTTVTFERNVTTAEIWAAADTATNSSSPDFAPLHADISPLPDGATSFVVPTPGDGQVTLVLLEPRHADLTVGVMRKLTITATPQAPHEEKDFVELPTTATAWLELTERGLTVTSLLARSKVGAAGTPSAWAAPTRIAGGASTVRGGVLGTLAVERDITLDATRPSIVEFQATLSNGAKIVYGPYVFDRDKNPNLYEVTVESTTNRYVTIRGDVDTLSVGLYRSTWKYEVEGTYAVIDVQAAGTNAVAGLAAATSGTFTAKAWSDPVVAIGGSSLFDSRDIIALNGAGAAAAVLDVYSAVAPTSGGNVVTLTFRATAAPGGWTIRVFIAESVTSTNPIPTVNRTSELTPVPSAPPTVSTAYAWTSAYDQLSSGTRRVTMKGRAELVNAGVVMDTKSFSASWYTSGSA